MDAAWFKRKTKEKRVTAEDIARAAGRTRQNISHMYAGKQRMTLDWARAFAEVLEVPLDEVLRRAGIADAPTARKVALGFAEGDAAPYAAQAGEADRIRRIATAFGLDRPGVDTWTVRTAAMALAGYLPGDHILVDSHAATRARAGDVVIAQIYDAQTASAETVLRRLEPPVLVAAGVTPEAQRVLVVDGRNVVVRGVVAALWRTPGRRALNSEGV